MKSYSSSKNTKQSEKQQRSKTKKLKKGNRKLVKKSKRIKQIWTLEEDEKLLKLIHTHGPIHWSLISSGMEDREGKQCRERWHNHLNPEIQKDSWTEEEDLRLFLLFKLFGSKWSILSYIFPGRTDNSIKNHWNSVMKKKVKRFETVLKSLIEKDDLSSLNPLDQDLIGKIKRSEFDNKASRKGRTRNYVGFFEKKNLIQFISKEALQMKVNDKCISSEKEETQSLSDFQKNRKLKSHFNPKMAVQNSMNKERKIESEDLVNKTPCSMVKRISIESRVETTAQDNCNLFPKLETEKITPFFFQNFFNNNENSIGKSMCLNMAIQSIYSKSNEKSRILEFKDVMTPTKTIFDLSNRKFTNSISSSKNFYCLSHFKSLEISKSLEYI